MSDQPDDGPFRDDVPVIASQGEDGEFRFYVYDNAAGDPRYGFWLQFEERGMSLYERTPAAGKWLKPERADPDDGREPSAELVHALGRLMHGDPVSTESIDALPPHEGHFLRVIEGTAEVDADRVPAPVWKFAWECWHEVESRNDPDRTPRESCPKCGGSVEVVSVAPLEEHCLNDLCNYYRAEANGGVIRE